MGALYLYVDLVTYTVYVHKHTFTPDAAPRVPYPC